MFIVIIFIGERFDTRYFRKIENIRVEGKVFDNLIFSQFSVQVFEVVCVVSCFLVSFRIRFFYTDVYLFCYSVYCVYIYMGGWRNLCFMFVNEFIEVLLF